MRVRESSERISFVVPKQLRKELRALQELTGEDQSSLLRRLLYKGMEEVKTDIAVDTCLKGKASLEKSAGISRSSLWDFLDELRRRNVALKYSVADAESEIRRAIEHRKAKSA